MRNWKKIEQAYAYRTYSVAVYVYTKIEYVNVRTCLRKNTNVAAIKQAYEMISDDSYLLYASITVLDKQNMTATSARSIRKSAEREQK